MLFATMGLLLLAPDAMWSQLRHSSVTPLLNVFEKSTGPAAVLIDARSIRPEDGEARHPHPLVALDPAFVPSEQLVYFAFRRQNDVAVPCSRALAAQCCGFGLDDVYHVEVSAALTMAILGTPGAGKAKWVRVLPGSDLASLGIAAFAGKPVIAAFLREELVGAQYVALYRRKHWPLEGSAQGASCSGHTHMQVTWARLPHR